MSQNFSGSLTIININIMKKIIFFFFTLFSLFAFSQQTDFNYQAIIKGSNGMAVSGQSVVMQFSIIYDAANGTVAYQETHTVNTSVDGLVNLVIGSGSPTSQTGDSWNTIDWGKPLFLKEEVNLGSGFATLGTGRIYSVPVANYAAKAGGVKGGTVSTTTVSATNINTGSISTTTVIATEYLMPLQGGMLAAITHRGVATPGTVTATLFHGGVVSATGITAAGIVTATAFSGNGSGLSNISAGAITGVISAAISTTHVTATTFSGDGSGLTNLPSSGANDRIWISHGDFGDNPQDISRYKGIFNGYYYEFLNMEKGSGGISQTRAYFIPPSHWGNGNYKVTLYYLTPNPNSGNIQVGGGIITTTMASTATSTSGSEFGGNSHGGFQYGGASGIPKPLYAAANVGTNSSFSRPLQKVTYTRNHNFSGIDYAVFYLSRYLNTGYSYSDTYNGDFYVVGVKIEKNY